MKINQGFLPPPLSNGDILKCFSLFLFLCSCNKSVCVPREIKEPSFFYLFGEQLSVGADFTGGIFGDI